LHELQDTSRDEFVGNYLISSTVERQFQVAIQADTAIAQIILAELGETVPEYANCIAGYLQGHGTTER
jgi:uncharacterized protein YutE (UPF0331/DUF86 family)